MSILGAYIIPDPLHPAIVHLPIALWLVSSLFLLLALWRPDFFMKAASWLLVIGTIGGIISYYTGPNAIGVAAQIFPSSSLNEHLNTHRVLAQWSTITYIVTTIGVFSYLFWKKNKYLKISLAVLGVIGGLLVFFTGHYAGRMLYEDL
ncbi:hypothetical protein H0266_11195 [Halobacillus locisalis]|uniref:DUF2231 domain-containing protein n=1 Tax=Halobacillus locisalis TaxID=220753 RepID=A0A838CUG8_9BACI|nr:DUF2231 domain-containing protein [Halobacillus locisalis]MBA2175459.1 hypothetical protein [Halobacillus locisalis]